MKLDISGRKFGRLTVINFSRTVHADASHYRRFWNCICECGKNHEVIQDALISGNCKSCGCLSSEMKSERSKTHGATGTSTYKIWAGIKKRCLQKNSSVFKKYGARGIMVCDRWMKFENFLSDMGERPKDMTIERKDNEGSYCADNCRWATVLEQASNKRNTVRIPYAGKIISLRAFAGAVKVPYKTLHKYFGRGDRGISLEDAVRKCTSLPRRSGS